MKVIVARRVGGSQGQCQAVAAWLNCSSGPQSHAPVSRSLKICRNRIRIGAMEGLTVPLERSHGLSAIDVLDRVLDKGIVCDYWARVSVMGIDMMTTIEARVIVASIETYVNYADAIRERDGAQAGPDRPAPDEFDARAHRPCARRTRHSARRPPAALWRSAA